MSSLNALRWTGDGGHYEVWFVTLVDRASGLGVWVRYTVHAPEDPAQPAETALWFVASWPDGRRVARRTVVAATQLTAADDPFRLSIGGDASVAGELRDDGARGALDDVAWDLTWTPSAVPGLPVHPLLERARLAKTMYVIPQPAVAISGTVTVPGRTVTLGGASGAQAHLWGAKHASGWGWTHATDLETLDGAPAPGDWLDAISIKTRRLRRTIAATSVSGRLLGDPFAATGPRAVLGSTASSGLTAYRGEATAGARRVRWDAEAARPRLVGVTYDDPDGERLRCWNSELATLQLTVWDRGQGRWLLRETLRAPDRACFEYAQRGPLADLPMDLA